MMKKYVMLFLSLVLLMTALIPFKGLAEEKENPDIELWNAVKPLSTTVTFLNTGAHPDDERSDLLAYLSRGLGVKTSSLIANRGEGGQNEIGNELDNALGIIRSNEMIEAGKITGVKAYHLSETTSDPIYDFGFSKSPEETLEKWGEELTYERLIRFIRTYQPDIVMPSFLDVDSQHGHHRAMTILSQRAFADAADPAVFPEQLEEGLSTWQTKKLYLPAESEETATISMEIGDYDPIYDMSYPQIGEESRYMHKSQGMGRDVPVEPKQFHLDLDKTIYSNQEEDTIFDGIPYDFTDWSAIISENDISVHLEKLQENLNEIVDSYPDREAILPQSQKVLKDVTQLVEKVEKGDIEASLKNDLLHKLDIKKEQLQEVSFVAAGLDVETKMDSGVLTQGETAAIIMEITNNGQQAIQHIDAALMTPDKWAVESDSDTRIKKLEPGKSEEVTFNVQVPEDAPYFQPYDESTVQASLTFKEKGTETANRLELNETVAVLPELAVSTNPEEIVVNTAEPKEAYTVNVTVKNYSKTEQQADVYLELPEGWTSEPEQAEVHFNQHLDEQTAAFKVTPPADIEEGETSIGVIASSGGKDYDTSVQEISYDHIKDSYYSYSSAMDVVSFELDKPESLKIGYIESGFDEVADYLMELGFDITKLDEADLQSGDLNQYDTIVTGIRANLSRPDLVENNQRLLEYAENGGHVVVQYHKPGDNWNPDETPPYPLEIGTPSIEWRVTDENSPVTVLQPEHKLFHFPNEITDHDWEGWVQERGLYFPMDWDEQYETFVSMEDPGEDPFTGGILLAEYGEGSYLYTNLVFYRQIAGQVPGGYRIFINLLSYGADE